MFRPTLYEQIEISSKTIIIDIQTNILPFIPRGIKQMVDHGYDHIAEVLVKTELILSWCEKNSVTITNIEKKLLEIATWSHDLGCVIERTGHGETSEVIFDYVKYNLDEELVGYIKTIIKYHTQKSKDEINRLTSEIYHGHTLRIDLLVAILKVADALDAGSRTHNMRAYANRAPEVLYEILVFYDKLGDCSKKHWRAHQLCTGIKLDKNQDLVSIFGKKGNTGEETFVEEIIFNSINKDIGETSDVFSRYGLPVLGTRLILK